MATRKKTSAKKNSAKKGVTRKKQTKKKSNTAAINPLQWIEFRVLARIVIAVAFAGGIYWLAGVQVEPVKSQKPSNETPSESETKLSGLSYDDFTFYSELKNFEVKVAEDNPYAQKDQREITYLIQAGAFKTFDRAEEQLVELTFLDLEPRIEQSGQWHRVLIGPVNNRSKMSAIRKRLIENGVQAKVMKQIAKAN